MSDVRPVTQSVLLTPQNQQIQDSQQRQAQVDNLAAGRQFTHRVDQRLSQVNQADKIESDALTADGRTDGGRGEEPGEEPEEASQAAQQKKEPEDPDLGRTIDVKA